MTQPNNPQPQEALNTGVNVPGVVETEEETAPVSSPVQRPGRQSFLPIKTNTWDRFFISVVCFVAIHLLWMRFVEQFIPLLVATVLSIILAVIIIWRG